MSIQSAGQPIVRSITFRQMVLLALETATRAGSLAIWRDGGTVGQAGDAAVTHGQRLPGEITAFLADHALALRDVDVLAVAAGPGSFTGLRVGIASVQGLALAAGRRVVPVSTLDAIGEAWLASVPGRGGLLVACLDGLRGEVFAAAWDVAADASTLTDASPRLEAAVLAPGALAARCHDLAKGRPITFVGNGAGRYRDLLVAASPGAGIDVPGMPLAEAIARIAGRAPDRAVPPHAVRPVYVRRPDAEVARERARAARPPDPLAHAGFEVRRATPDDFEAVAVLQRLTFTNPWGVEAIRWELEHTDVARLYILATADREIVGYCACWVVFDELHINSLAIAEPWRRRGLAQRLLRAVFDDTAGSGATSATLEVRQSNVAACALYASLGFEVEGRRRDYYQHPREDALVLWNRRLGPR